MKYVLLALSCVTLTVSALAQDTPSSKPLFETLEKALNPRNSTARFEEALKHAQDVNAADAREGRKPRTLPAYFFHACAYVVEHASESAKQTQTDRCEEILRILVATPGVDFKKTFGDNESALTVAMNQAPFLLTGLKDAKTIDFRGEDGRLMVNTALHKGDLSLLETLLNAGAPSRDLLQAAAMECASNDVLNFVLKRPGVSLNGPSAHQALKTILLGCKEKDKAQLLFDAGLDANAIDTTQTTMLMVVAGECDKDNVTFLIENGADAKLQNKAHQTATSFAQASYNKPVYADPKTRKILGRNWIVDCHATKRVLENADKILRKGKHASASEAAPAVVVPSDSSPSAKQLQ